MKKLVVAAILCSLLFSTAFADEITFRGIPWGSSMSRVEEKLSDKQLSVRDEAGMRRWENIQSVYDPNYFDEYPSGWSGDSWAKTDVAGYDAYIKVYCAYDLKADGSVDRNKENSEFYAAKYDFSVMDYDTAYNALKSKLTSLYGTGKETVENYKPFYAFDGKSGYYHQEAKCTVWNGDNNTAVKLYCITEDLDIEILSSKTLSICYGKTDKDEDLDKLQKAIYQEKLGEEYKRQSSSTNGL